MAGNTRWGQEHPDQSYGLPSACHIPLTTDYLEFLGTSITEALERSKMDDPTVVGSNLFREVDWLMNEAGDLANLEAARRMVGRRFSRNAPLTPALPPSDGWRVVEGRERGSSGSG